MRDEKLPCGSQGEYRSNHSTVQYSTVQYSTVQYSTVQSSTALYSWTQNCAKKYGTIHSPVTITEEMHDTTVSRREVRLQSCTSQYSARVSRYSTAEYSTDLSIFKTCSAVVQNFLQRKNYLSSVTSVTSREKRNIAEGRLSGCVTIENVHHSSSSLSVFNYDKRDKTHCSSFNLSTLKCDKCDKTQNVHCSSFNLSTLKCDKRNKT